MAKTILNVNGMSCSHCEKAIIKAVSALSGVSKVSVDLAVKTVTVDDQAGLVGPADFKDAIEDHRYDIV